MNLAKVGVELEDSVFNGFIPGLTKTETFVVKESVGDFSYDSGYVFALHIALKGEQKLYKRKVYSLLDMMGDIGGLHDALFLLASFLIGSYNASMFDLAVVRNLFKFQKFSIKLPAKI
jgi:hypothetical protein